jgi:hypothetical protein
MKKARNMRDLDSALRRKKAQRRKYRALPVAEKLRLMDRLHDNAAILRSFRRKSNG